MKKDSKKTIEKIQSVDPFDPDIFESDFDYYLLEACQVYNIDDLVKETPHRWNAVLIYINKHCIANKSIKDITPYYNNNNINNNILDKFINTDTKNRYNDDYILYIASIYLDKCMIYNKIPSLYSFSLLSGICVDLLYSFQHCEPTSKRFSIYKNIMLASENTLSDELTNGGANKIGVITRLNHQFNWATVAAANGSQTTQTALQAQDLPRLEVVQDNKV